MLAAEALSARFAAAVADDDPSLTRSLVEIGLEEELLVYRGSRQVDFARLLPRLRVEGRRIDPRDPGAYRCAWGGLLTADGREAELAIPPLPQRPGFVVALEQWTAVARCALRALLPRDVTLSGYSTHFNVGVPEAFGDEIAALYLGHFAASTLLLTDRGTSPGILVRPRPGRLEICTEHVDGPILRAAAAFVVGAVRACTDAVAGRSTASMLPPALAVDASPAIARFGWHAGPAAFGDDLHGGRRAAVRLSGGGVVSAQDHLERSWRVARAHVLATPADLSCADAMVSGALAIPVDRPASPLSIRASSARSSPFATVLRLVPRRAFAASPRYLSWDVAVIKLTSRRRTAYAAVPRRSLARFVTAYASGLLDGVVSAYLAAPAAGRVLRSADQTRDAGLFDDVAGPRAVIVRERPKTTGYRPVERQRGCGTPLIVALGVAVLVVALLAAGALGGLFGSRTPPTPAPTVASATASAAASVAAVLPPGQCSGPIVVISDQFYPDVVQGGNGTPTTFSTGGKRYCLVHLASYHWNDGKGDPPASTDTLSVRDANGTTLGSWRVVGTPGTGGTLSGWEADVPLTPAVVVDGTYTLIDSRSGTWSWSRASGGKGFIRVWGVPYVTQ